MGFAPNVDAAMFLACSIFPEIRRVRPDVKLCLVGRNPDPCLQRLTGSRSGITVTGAVDDMVPYLHAATVYAAPHFTGAGTRTKLLEAMAAGLAIVTTSIGIEGIDALHEQEVMIANDRSSLITAVLHLLGNPRERIRLGNAARRLMEERYDWSRCLAPLESLYAGLLPKKVISC
jgi:glycosyltransferase involved in cell wall biosynthesis